MRASIQHSPILKELYRRGNHECYMQRQRIWISDSGSNSDISPGVARYQDRRSIQVGLCMSLIYPFRGIRDSHFRSCRKRQHLLCRAPLTARRSSMSPNTIQSHRPRNRPPLRSVCTTSSNAMWRRCLQATPVCRTVCRTESTCFGTAERSCQWSQGMPTSHTVYIFPARRCSSIDNTLLLCSQRHFRKSCSVARACHSNRLGRWYLRHSVPGPSRSSFRPVRNSFKAHLRGRGRRASAAGEGGRRLHGPFCRGAGAHGASGQGRPAQGRPAQGRSAHSGARSESLDLIKG
jgi:hypothetical protein